MALDFEEYFPADSDFKILADGLFRGVGCGIDERLVLPYRGVCLYLCMFSSFFLFFFFFLQNPLEGHEIAFNKFVDDCAPSSKVCLVCYPCVFLSLLCCSL